MVSDLLENHEIAAQEKFQWSQDAMYELAALHSELAQIRHDHEDPAFSWCDALEEERRLAAEGIERSGVLAHGAGAASPGRQNAK